MGKISVSDKKPTAASTAAHLENCIQVRVRVHCAAFLASPLYCILLEHQSFRTISPILAQFSAFWKEQRADCTNTRLTDAQTPDKGASCARVSPVFLFFTLSFIGSFIPSPLPPWAGHTSSFPPSFASASLKCHLFTIATGLN